MDFTDEDEETLLGIVLDERSHSSPAGLQTDGGANESYRHSFMVNVYNDMIDSATGIGSLRQNFGVPPKRCTTTEIYELQELGGPKRKRLHRVHSDQNTRSNCLTDISNAYKPGREETTTKTEDSQLTTLVNKITNMELEIKGLKAGDDKLSEGLNSLTEQNKRLGDRIEQLEVNGLCVVCYKDKINIWVNPCQHWVMCVSCYKKLCKTMDENTGNEFKKCPVCRENINYALPFYGM